MATADYYRQKLGLSLTPVGKFIDADAVTARQHARQRVLFVNPSLQKGEGIVIQLALRLEKRRPEIQFEVVESRGDWPDANIMVTMDQDKEIDLVGVLTGDVDGSWSAF